MGGLINYNVRFLKIKSIFAEIFSFRLFLSLYHAACSRSTPSTETSGRTFALADAGWLFASCTYFFLLHSTQKSMRPVFLASRQSPLVHRHAAHDIELRNDQSGFSRPTGGW